MQTQEPGHLTRGGKQDDEVTLARARIADHAVPGSPPDWTFTIVAAYLRDRGWWNDGQDPGVWMPDQVTLGVALDTQLARDGFSPYI